MAHAIVLTGRVLAPSGLMIQKLRHIYGLPGVGYSGPRGQLQGRGGIFYDLGCGIGRPLVAAAVLYPFDVCYGIEVLEGLYHASNLVVDAYNTKVLLLYCVCLLLLLLLFMLILGCYVPRESLS